MATNEQPTLFEIEVAGTSNNNKVLKLENRISPFLTTLERTFIKACYGQKLKSIPKAEALRKLLDFITKAFAETGQEISGYTKTHQHDTVSMLSKLTYEDLMLYHPNVTIDEIQLAIRNGIRHAYGDYFGINSVSINQFVTNYIKDTERKAAIQRQKAYMESLVEKPPVSLTPEQEDEIGNNILSLCFEQYKKTKDFIDGGFLAYEYAVKKGYISLNKEQKCEIYEQAIEEVEADEIKQAQINYYNRFKKKSEKELIFLYKSKAMHISLRRYFDYMIRIEKGQILTGIDLSKPIEEQKD